jgi:hypothetical protein
MGELAEQLKARTMRFALDVCASIQQLPNREPGWTVQRQLARAARRSPRTHGDHVIVLWDGTIQGAQQVTRQSINQLPDYQITQSPDFNRPLWIR